MDSAGLFVSWQDPSCFPLDFQMQHPGPSRILHLCPFVRITVRAGGSAAGESTFFLGRVGKALQD